MDKCSKYWLQLVLKIVKIRDVILYDIFNNFIDRQDQFLVRQTKILIKLN